MSVSRSIILTALTALALSANLSRADLVAHWPLDSDANDASGNGHNGAVVDGTVTFGGDGANANTGSSADFPDNGHIDIPFDAALNPESFTVALWANAASTDGFASPITSRDDAATPSTHGYILYNNSGGSWDFWTGDGDPGWDSLIGAPVTTDTWTHLAITYDAASDTKSLWIDGILSATDDIPQSGPTQYSPNGPEMENLHIGSGQDDGLNFYFSGNIDDVGIWDEALDETTIQSIMENGIGSGLPDPFLSVANPIDLPLDGSVQEFDIIVTNSGATQDLTVSAAAFTGDPNFTTVSLPAGAISPGDSGDIRIKFDPLGSNGAFEADLEITSNDELNPMRTITVSGIIHDPMLVADTTLDLGTATSGSLPVTNDGATRTLNLSSFSLSGDSTNFTISNFPPSLDPGGGSGSIDIGFDAKGGEGTFRAMMTINSDDPINPAYLVELVAVVPITNPLIAWWPLDQDGTDASGNGFDGAVVGGVVTFGEAGASDRTGFSAAFPDNGHIDVPFDAALNPESFTVALWANAASTDGFASPITSRDDVTGTSVWGYVLYNNNDGNWDFWTGGGGPSGSWDRNIGPAVSVDTWTHLALTYDAADGTKTLWVNGVSEASDAVLDQYLPNGTVEMENLHIGAGADDGGSFHFSGNIDDVALFGTALPETDIQSIMDNGVAGFIGATELFQMLPLVFGPEPGQITVSWTSQEGATYALDRSTDLTTDKTSGSWEELDDGIEGEAEVTTFLDTDPPAGATRLYYRARRL